MDATSGNVRRAANRSLQVNEAALASEYSGAIRWGNTLGAPALPAPYENERLSGPGVWRLGNSVCACSSDLFSRVMWCGYMVRNREKHDVGMEPEERADAEGGLVGRRAEGEALHATKRACIQNNLKQMV